MTLDSFLEAAPYIALGLAVGAGTAAYIRSAGKKRTGSALDRLRELQGSEHAKLEETELLRRYKEENGNGLVTDYVNEVADQAHTVNTEALREHPQLKGLADRAFMVRLKSSWNA